MKKLLAFAGLAAASIALVGCGANNGSPEDTFVPYDTTEKAVFDVVHLGQKAHCTYYEDDRLGLRCEWNKK